MGFDVLNADHIARCNRMGACCIGLAIVLEVVEPSPFLDDQCTFGAVPQYVQGGLLYLWSCSKKVDEACLESSTWPELLEMKCRSINKFAKVADKFHTYAEHESDVRIPMRISAECKRLTINMSWEPYTFEL